MSNWKLPSQHVSTDKLNIESTSEFLHRHEIMRRISAEKTCIDLLDFIKSLPNTEETTKIMNKFLDQTTVNG